MDSFNVTAADPEQNRLHAVCDMEYRLSNKLGLGKASGVGLSNLVATSPQLPFNPFTAPLAAVTAHIELLKKQKEYLEAQSAAFGGTSTSTTGIGLTVSSVGKYASGAGPTTTLATTAAVNQQIQLKFTTTGAIPKDHSIYITAVNAAADGLVLVAGTDIVSSVTTSAELHCYDRRTSATDSDNGKCRLEDGTTEFAPAYSATALSAATANGVAFTYSTAQTEGTYVASTNAAGTSPVDFTATIPNSANPKALRWMYKMPTTQGLRAITDGEWYLPQGATVGLVNAAMKVTMEVMDTTGKVVATGSATSTI